MGKIEEAQEILKAIGLPAAQQNEMSALTLLALCGIKENDRWSESYQHSSRVTKEIMKFVADNYGRPYGPNTRETFRRFVLHQFVQAGIVDYNPDNPELPTNSPNAHYAITEDALEVIKSYGTDRWENMVKKFIVNRGRLIDVYQKRRQQLLIPVKLPDGSEFKLSPGKHNELQAAIIEKFAPRFVPGSVVMYLGDTAKKNLIINQELFDAIGVSVSDHNKLPDIVLLDKDNHRIYLIEAVTSHGPMSPKRVIELEHMFKNAPLIEVYVSAFPKFSEFKKYASEISWDTEVWIAEIPEHMIHYNGDKYLSES